MSVKEAVNKIKKLKPLEKLEIVEEIWNSIEIDNSDIEVPNAHKKILDYRLKEHKKNPKNTISLKNFKEEMKNEIRNRSKSRD